MKYYPEIETKISYRTPEMAAEYNTFLRKKHNDKWYKVHISKTYQINPLVKDVTEVALNSLNMFHREVYLFSILGKIQEGIFSTDGREMFQVDTDQTEETERLTQLLIL